MAKRDVQLVIRAKNTASKELDKINESLDLLRERQGEVIKSSVATNAAFGKTDDALRSLATTARRDTAKMAERVATAYKNIETAVDQSRGALNRQEAELKESKAVLGSLESQIESAQRAIVDLSIAMRQSDPDGKLARQLALVQSTLATLTKEAGRARTAISTQESALESTTADYRSLEQAAMAAAAAMRQVNAAAAARASRAASLAQTQATRQQSGFNAFSARATALDPAANRAAELRAAALRLQNEKLLAARAVNEASGFRRLNQQIEAADKSARQLKSVADAAALANKQARKVALIDAIRAREASEERGFVAFTQKIRERARADLEAAEAARAARVAALERARADNARSGFNAFSQTADRNAVLAQRQAALEASRATNAASGFNAFSQAASRAAVVGRTPDTANLRDVLRVLMGIPKAVDPAANALRRAAGEASNLRRVFGAFYGDSRKALSFFQRLRGEVLSVTASFAGLYGVIEGGRGVAKAYMTLEAAQSRLGAVFNQNADLVGREVRWLQEEAKRLGISFATLSDEYGKFAVATDAAGFSNESTRQIFIRVAEAARVNKLSVEQVSGVMLALQQIVSKGKVSSEELRRQMGDRLPGAFNIFADALGMTAAELDKALEAGEVFATESNLLAFADQLDKRFGAQLPAALKSFTTQLGRFQNNVFSSQLVAGQGGLIDGMTAALTRLNEFFESDQGVQFFTDLGAAAGKLLMVVPALVENFDLLLLAFQGFIVLKLGQVFAALFVNLQQANGGLAATRAALLGVSIQLSTMAGSGQVAAAAITRVATAGTAASFIMLRVATAARAMWIAIGGPVGVVATLISFFAVGALGDMLTATDKANTALSEHAEVLGEVKDAYIDTKGDIDKFRDSLDKATLSRLKAQQESLKAAVEELRQGLGNPFGSAGREFGSMFASSAKLKAIKDLKSIADAFRDGRMKATEFEAALGELFEATGDLIDLDVRQKYLDDAEAAVALEKALADNAAAQDLVAGSAEEAAGAVDQLGIAFDEMPSGGALQFLETFDDALDRLKEKIPALKEELDKLKAIEEIEAAYDAAIAAARNLPDGTMRAAGIAAAERYRDQALSAVEAEYIGKQIGTEMSEAMLRVIKAEEGLRLKAYDDGFGNLTIGYGHTNAAGGFQFDANTEITEQQALDILAQDLAKFIAQVEALVDVPITDAMKAALVSYQYNTGKLAGSEIIRLLNEGDYAGAQEALRNGINTANGEVVDGLTARRAREADLFGSEGFSNFEIESDRAERQREEADALREYNDEFERRIDNMEFERSIAEMDDRDAAVAEAIRQEELAALEAGVELTAARRAEVERLAGALWDSQNAERMSEEQREAAMARVNNLMAERAELLERLAYQQQIGDTKGIEETEQKIAELEIALQEATAAARGLWETLPGGPQKDEALRSLQDVEDGVNRMDTRFLMTAEQWNEFIAGSVTSAFTTMAEEIANGENALKSLGNAFRKIAADILLRLGQMIIEQAVFNALAGAFGGNGGVGGVIANLAGKLFHDGGVVGEGSGPSRGVPAGLFANAVRYHNGGVAGLKPNEVPAILEQGEEVLTAGDPRHRANGGTSKGSDTTVINAIDPVSFVEAALRQAPGRNVVLNFLRANQAASRQALGV